jgi:hypothetical protein
MMEKLRAILTSPTNELDMSGKATHGAPNRQAISHRRYEDPVTDR